ncbi:MAG: DUF1887 family protein [Bacteroidaceae bacterium]|nr:DUF1887 family protein [Bacteroidaceae bacterium]
MSKIHITLVGGQPAPIYHGIVATQPDKVVYIYSQDTVSILEKLKIEIQIFCETYLLDVTEPNRIKQCAEMLAERYKEDEVTVNISSGLKSWSHWFGVVFDKCPNATVVYMDQNNTLWNYRTMQASSEYTFDMQALFRLYGNPIDNNYTPFSEYTDEDFAAIKKVEAIRKVNHTAFNKLTALLDTKKKNILTNQKTGRFTDTSMSEVRWDKDACKVEITLFAKKYVKSETIESPHAVDIVFNSGWFEAKIARLLSRWRKAKEICINCRFPFKPKVDKNEVDIIVNTGAKILFVECKTQIANTTDIDKFRSVIKGYGGMGSKGLFITDAPMSDIAKAKCEERGILTFSLQDEHLGMNAEKALFMLLESDLESINTK